MNRPATNLGLTVANFSLTESCRSSDPPNSGYILDAHAVFDEVDGGDGQGPLLGQEYPLLDERPQPHLSPLGANKILVEEQASAWDLEDRVLGVLSLARGRIGGGALVDKDIVQEAGDEGDAILVALLGLKMKHSVLPQVEQADEARGRGVISGMLSKLKLWPAFETLGTSPTSG
eukprot:scaffold73583_cov62-Phaeocystis_antarctica.AAC.6